ncbi:hypothetical protein ABZV21_15715 [Streptomyces clavifer]
MTMASAAHVYQHLFGAPGGTAVPADPPRAPTAAPPDPPHAPVAALTSALN